MSDIIEALIDVDDERRTLPPGVMVLSDGRVYGRRGGLRRPFVDRYGYLQLTFYCRGRREHWPVHRLVCWVFHGPPPSRRHQAAHLNGVRTDNRAENLAWKTQAENEADKRLHGTHLAGERKPLAKLTVTQVQEIREAYATGDVSQRALARKYGVHQALIWGIVNDQRWRAA